MSNHFRAALMEGLATESPGLGINASQLCIRSFWPAYCRVRRDDTGKTTRRNEFQNFVQRFEREIGSHFDEDRLWVARDLLLLKRRQDIIQGCLVLQLAEIRRVWRTDV